MHLHIGGVNAGAAKEKELRAEHHGVATGLEPAVVPTVRGCQQASGGYQRRATR